MAGVVYPDGYPTLDAYATATGEGYDLRGVRAARGEGADARARSALGDGEPRHRDRRGADGAACGHRRADRSHPRGRLRRGTDRASRPCRRRRPRACAPAATVAQPRADGSDCRAQHVPAAPAPRTRLDPARTHTASAVWRRVAVVSRGVGRAAARHGEYGGAGAAGHAGGVFLQLRAHAAGAGAPPVLRDFSGDYHAGAAGAHAGGAGAWAGETRAGVALEPAAP
jgi:hypothetical protein